MRTFAFCLVLLLVVHSFSADCAEYELYKEILGYPVEIISSSNIAVDKDGMIWVSSGGRVFRNNGNIWEDFTENSGGASMVSASSDGVLWFADNEHLARFDGTDWTSFTESIELSGKIKNISAGPDNILWIATSESISEDPTGPTITQHYLSRFDGEELVVYSEELLQNNISRLTATSDGGVWVIYYNFFDQWDCMMGDNCPLGTSYFNGETFHHFTSGNGFPVTSDGTLDVKWIIQNHDGLIYAFILEDLYQYSDETWSKFTSFPIQAILVSGYDGNIWCGYFGQPISSLGVLNNDEWIYYDVYNISQELRNEMQYLGTSSMVVTQESIVWMGLDDCFIKIDPSKLSILGTSVESEQPTAFSCNINNYPNPFNPATTLTYSIAKPSHVKLEVYAITGQKVATLVDGIMSEGQHSARFDGSGLASGIYIFRFDANGIEKTGKMILVK
ncbi:T9SS type A sorting domain-containing protein [Candidatus Latescibacterota bacterium]